MRTFMLGSPVTSCRFLRANANFVVAGTLAGELHILNCSTALTQVLACFACCTFLIKHVYRCVL